MRMFENRDLEEDIWTYVGGSGGSLEKNA